MSFKKITLAIVKVKSSGVDKLVGDNCRVMGGFEMWEWKKTQLKKHCWYIQGSLARVSLGEERE